MPNYNNSKIYKIICNTTNCIYVGSTVSKLNIRLSRHKSDYNRLKNGLTLSYYTSFEILKNNNYEIELIENYPCNSKKELLQREGYYIRKLNCVNKVIPNRSRKEREGQISYKIKNKIRKKKWAEKNKDKIKASKIKFRNQRIICDCGDNISKEHIKRHAKSKRHINYMNGDWIFNIIIV